MLYKKDLNYNAIKLKIKHKINNFIDDSNCNDFTGFEILEKFMANYYLLVSPTFSDYVLGNRPPKRKLIVAALNIFGWIVNLRFAILAIVNKPWIWTLLGDPNYIAGKPNLISLMLLSFGCLATTVGNVYHNMERNKKLDVISYIHKIWNKSDNYQLSHEYNSKYCHRIKLVAEHVLKRSVDFPAVVIILTNFLASIVVYFHSDYNYSAITLIIWNISLSIWIFQCFAKSWADFFLFYITVLYLKYQFKQIKDQVRRSFQKNNVILLMNAINKHHFYSQLTTKFNNLFKYNLAIVYFTSGPALALLLSLALNSTFNLYIRIAYYVVIVQICIALYVFNYIASSYSSSAHSFTSIMYKFLNEKQISIEHKLKINTFIEKITGPAIGFYCLDFFPFNSYELYRYIMFISASYILVNNAFDFRK